MQPTVRYATTTDGVSIAFSEAGEGPALFYLPNPPLAHAQLVWELFASSLEDLVSDFRVVYVNSRGCGLSSTDRIDFSLEAMVKDIDAVVVALGLPSIALFGWSDGSPIGIAYAAARPSLVSHLVVGDSYTRGSEYLGSAAMQVEMALREKDWTIYSETLARVLMGFDDAEFTKALAAYIRASTTPEIHRLAYHTMVNEWDVAESLPLVRARTLVLHNKKSPWLPVESGRRVAAGIPGAQFRLIDDLAFAEVAPIIKDFVLPPDRYAQGTATPAVASPFRTILFTDIEGHTAMMSRLGDARGREILREHERTTRECLREHGGSEVKTMGDGFLASFGSAQKALDCATALQQAFSVSGSPLSPGAGREGLRIRIGVNAGEPVAEDDDLFGTSVIVAARIAAKAGGGQILVADVVRQLVAGKGFLFSDTGEHVLKGFEEPVRVWEQRWERP